MDSRTLKQIRREVRANVQPLVRELRNQIRASRPEQRAMMKGLRATKENAFSDIASRAKASGSKYSGVPIEEQSKYVASTFLPAVAQQRGQFRDIRENKRLMIADALSKAGNLSQELWQKELDRQAALRAASIQASAWTPTRGGMPTGGGNQNWQGQMVFDKDTKTFAFKDPQGNPISAAGFASLNQRDFRDILGIMANRGDRGAAEALGFVGNDFGFDPSKLYTGATNYQDSQRLASLYNALAWGAPGFKDAQVTALNPSSGVYGSTLGGTF